MVEDDDIPPVEGDDALLTKTAEDRGDRLSRRPDHCANVVVGESQLDPLPRGGGPSIRLGKPQEQRGQTPGDVAEDEVDDLLLG